ncbi:pre-mRNA-splicing factor CWC22 homolog isoform X2 [Mya arenaria]|uniref:pre-mRNA-splicing factor CWC22 homolog isoform X2 n=1 Tax=Mya arenaria TaxID=6604 RepID=UPI0022E12815|nr:pre-mRNA-splicing factor CWC22 homolog isoform X2 [Mya arenaria]
MKPKTNRRGKERASDKDTVVAYHEFIQGRIHGELNGVSIGPGYLFSKIALCLVIFGAICLVIGCLLITLRHRHVYLVDWNAQFLGPFFVAMFLLCCGIAVFLLQIARNRTNQYRKDLAFRPIGDYGVAVVHKSKLSYEEQKKTELKSGTTPHNVRHPGRPGVNDRGNQGDYSKPRGYDNRGYKDDRDRPRDNRDGRDRPRRQPQDEHDRPLKRDMDRPDEKERGRRPPDDRDRRRRPPDDEERKRRPPDDRRRPPDDRRGPDDRDRSRRPPQGPEDEKRRAEARRRYEDDKRRRLEEDRRRAELRKQAEANSQFYPSV